MLPATNFCESGLIFWIAGLVIVPLSVLLCQNIRHVDQISCLLSNCPVIIPETVEPNRHFTVFRPAVDSTLRSLVQLQAHPHHPTQTYQAPPRTFYVPRKNPANPLSFHNDWWLFPTNVIIDKFFFVSGFSINQSSGTSTNASTLDSPKFYIWSFIFQLVPVLVQVPVLVLLVRSLFVDVRLFDRSIDQSTNFITKFYISDFNWYHYFNKSKYWYYWYDLSLLTWGFLIDQSIDHPIPEGVLLLY